MPAIRHQVLSPAAQTAWLALAFVLAIGLAMPWAGIAVLAAFSLLQLTVRGRGEPAASAPLTARDAEDAIDDRLVVAYLEGDRSALDEIHARYFDRIRACAHVAVREVDDPDFVARRVFMRVASGLARRDRHRAVTFRVWLFRLARRTMLEARAAHLHAREPARCAGRRHSVRDGAVGWIGEREARVLREQFSASDGSALALCYALDLSVDELAEGLGRAPHTVRELLSRSLHAFEARRIGEVRRGGACTRLDMVLRERRGPVLTARRAALSYGGRAL